MTYSLSVEFSPVQKSISTLFYLNNECKEFSEWFLIIFWFNEILNDFQWKHEFFIPLFFKFHGARNRFRQISKFWVPQLKSSTDCNSTNTYYQFFESYLGRIVKLLTIFQCMPIIFMTHRSFSVILSSHIGNPSLFASVMTNGPM